MTQQDLVFDNTHFEVIDRNGQHWLRGAQIAEALGYSDGSAITRIYARHADEFTEEMTGSVKLTDPNGDLQETRIFSPRGCYALGMFARTDRARDFRVWVLDVLEGKHTHLVPHQPINPELQSRIDRRAWQLAHPTYERLRERMMADEQILSGEQTPEAWDHEAPLQYIFEMLEMQANINERNATLIRHRGREMAKQAGVDYDEMVETYINPWQREERLGRR